MVFERISGDPMIMAGVPCIRGTHLPVATVVAYVAEGQSPEEIARNFPQLTVADVLEALALAAETLRERGDPAQHPLGQVRPGSTADHRAPRRAAAEVER